MLKLLAAVLAVASLPMTAFSATTGPIPTEFGSAGFAPVTSAIDGGTVGPAGSPPPAPLSLARYSGPGSLVQAIITLTVSFDSLFSFENTSDAPDNATMSVLLDGYASIAGVPLMKVSTSDLAFGQVTATDGVMGSGPDRFSGMLSDEKTGVFSFSGAELASFTGPGSLAVEFAADTLNLLAATNANGPASFQTTGVIDVDVEYITANVPLPASALLLITALGGIAAAKRRARKPTTT